MVALVIASANVVISAVAGAGAYLASVTVLVPGASFDPGAWSIALGRRWLAVVAAGSGGALVLGVVNRVLFGWAHGGEAAPEPRALLVTFLAAVALGLGVGSVESLLVHL